jgi:hypothetical protein
VRADDVADDALVVMRAASDIPELVLRAIIMDAADSGSVYVIERPDGKREVLYGVSFFAVRSEQRRDGVLARFSSAPACLETAAGELRLAGMELWATGTNPDHYDVQILPGRVEGRDDDASPDELLIAATRLLVAAGELRPNPSYAG